MTESGKIITAEDGNYVDLSYFSHKAVDVFAKKFVQGKLYIHVKGIHTQTKLSICLTERTAIFQVLVLLVQTPKRSFPQNWHGFYLHKRVSFTYYKVTQPESYAKKTSCDHLLQITVSCCARSQSSFISWLRYFFFLPQDCVMGFYLIYLPISTPPHTHIVV